MWYPDSWSDLLRVGLCLISLWSCITLLLRWKKYSTKQEWTPKTKDYWYALFMWTIVGMVVPIQGIILDRPFTPATVAIAAAVLVTGTGLSRKGDWGGSDD